MQNDTAACNITRSHALMPVRHAVIEYVYATDTNVQVVSYPFSKVLVAGKDNDHNLIPGHSIRCKLPARRSQADQHANER